MASGCAAAGDWVLAALVVVAGIFALSPLSGLRAARETIAARRRRRAILAELRAGSSEIWARQALRNAAATRNRRPAEP